MLDGMKRATHTPAQHRVSAILDAAIYDEWKATGLTLTEVITRGLAAPAPPDGDEPGPGRGRHAADGRGAPLVVEVGPVLTELLRSLIAAPAPAIVARPRPAPAARLDAQFAALWDAYGTRDRIAVTDVRAVLNCGWSTASRIMSAFTLDGRATLHPRPLGGAYTWTINPPSAPSPADG